MTSEREREFETTGRFRNSFLDATRQRNLLWSRVRAVRGNIPGAGSPGRPTAKAKVGLVELEPIKADWGRNRTEKGAKRPRGWRLETARITAATYITRRKRRFIYLWRNPGKVYNWNGISWGISCWRVRYENENWKNTHENVRKEERERGECQIRVFTLLFLNEILRPECLNCYSLNEITTSNFKWAFITKERFFWFEFTKELPSKDRKTVNVIV